VSQLRKYSLEPHVIICLSVEEVLNRTSGDNLSLKLSHEVLMSTSSTERKIITWCYIEYFLNWDTLSHDFSQLRKYSIEPHVIICLSIEEVLNRTSCDNFSLSSTEKKIITWGSIEYFLNWETNYHMRFYCVLPQLRDKLSHEVLFLSWGSTQENLMMW
jgi:hypothetical protein